MNEFLYVIICCIVVALFSLLFFLKKLNNRVKILDNSMKLKVSQEEKQEINGKLLLLEQQISELKTFFDEEQITIQNLTNELKYLKSNLAGQNKIIEEQQSKIREFERKLSIFTEIENDSKNLNTTTASDSNEQIIDKILSTVQSGDDTPESEKNVEKDIEGKFPIVSVKAISEERLDEEQKAAYLMMEKGDENFFITGKAGTGKSFLLRMFERGTKKNILKLAPTGIAALNIGGTTLHSIFGFNNLEKLDISDISQKSIMLSDEKQMVLKKADTIIIDEISMVRVDTFDKINKILQIVNNTDRLFGGKQVILFGDVFQLPPIASKDEERFLKEKYGSMYFFDSQAYKDGKFAFIELKTNHRQEGDEIFFEILNRIREGKLLEQDFDLINKRVVNDTDTLRRIVRLYPRRQEAEAVNNSELEKIPAKEYSYRAVIEINKNNQSVSVENYFQAMSTLKLKLGALVMITKNDPQKRWVNGTLGIVSKISADKIFLTINGQEYEMTPEPFEQREAIYKDGKIEYDVVLRISQYPLMLAYAITIHKSQGSTYKSIVCDPYDCFAPGQAYVALSRCESLGGLNLIRALTLNRVKVDSRVKDFYLHNSSII